MKNKILIFSKHSKIGDVLTAELPEMHSITATSIEQFRNFLNVKEKRFIAIVTDLTTDEGWRILEYAKTRIEVENLDLPVFAIISSFRTATNDDSPFIEDESKNITESSLALEYKVSAVVVETPDYGNLIPFLQSLETDNSPIADDAAIDLDRTHGGINLETAWQEISTELKRLQSELLQHRAKQKSEGMTKSNESARLARVANGLKTLKINE